MKRVLLLCGLFVLMNLTGLAQSNMLDFTSDDETLRFSYPAAWAITENGDSTILVEHPGATITLTSPAVLAESLFSDISDPARLADAIARENDYTQRDFRLFVSGNGLAARYDYDNAGTVGIFLVFPINADTPIVFDIIPDGSIPANSIQRDIEILMTTLEFAPQSDDAAIDTSQTDDSDESSDNSAETSVSADGLVAFSS
ncbi:MAG: hypothetical protein ACPG7F_03100, partial [Aggregatilineales bacterium]